MKGAVSMGLEDFKIKIFADGANLDDMLAVYHKGLVKGFTTNPSLCKCYSISEPFKAQTLTKK